MKIFSDFNEEELVPGMEEVIQEGKTHTSYPEDPLHVHVIPDEVESSRMNENINSLEPSYLKKATDKDMSAYDRVQRAHKN